MNKWMKKLTAALCAAVLMCGMAVTAYAGGGEEWDGLDPVEPPPMETVDPGEGFTEDGNLVTRDLLYDKVTNKQFITVQTSGGNTLYIVIDYDKPTDEDGEQYQTYFLNMVDEADLLAAMQAAGGELPVCSCADKCAVGAINADCTVCAVNMGECQGKAPEPAPVVEPEPDPEPEQPKNSGGTILLVLAVAAGILRSTAPKSGRPPMLRRTTATITTIPRLGRTRTKRKVRMKHEIYQQSL